jgi:hypothetical protein
MTMAALLGISAANSNAATVLMNNNSSIAISPNNPTGPGDWDVDGVNQLGEEWFWFRIGSAVGQSNIASLPASLSVYDTTGDGENDTAESVYGSTTGLQITVIDSLVGGQTGSKTSDLGETVEISNNTSSPEAYHFFEYTNFNLDDLMSGQTVTITGGNTATVVGNGFEAQTVVSPKPSEFEASDAAASPDLLSYISSTVASTTLNNVASAPSGDSEWGFEWDGTLGAHSSYVISIDKEIQSTTVNAAVPEPTGDAIALLGFGGLFMIRPRRRREEAAGA